MAGATLTTFSNILKDLYEGPIQKQFYNENILLSRLKRNTKSVSGKKFIIPVHYGRNVGIGNRGELGDLPTAGNQQFLQTEISPAYLYGKIYVTDVTIEASRNDQGAFVRAIEAEMAGLQEDIKYDVNRQMFSGGTGHLTACGTTTAAQTINVDSTANLTEGMVVDIVTITTGAAISNGSAITVATIPSSTTFTITSAAVTTSSSHAVVRTGNVASVGGAAVSYEMQGLNSIVKATGALQGIDPATYKWWVAVVENGSSVNRSISNVIIQKTYDNLKKNGAMPSLLVTTDGVIRAYMELYEDAKRFVDTKTLDGGWEAVLWNGKPMVAEPMADLNTILMLDEKHLKIYETAPLGWMDRDGTVLHRSTTKAAYEAVMKWYANLGTTSRNKHGRIGYITEE